MKKLANPKLHKVFCIQEPCKNDQKANSQLISDISLDLMAQNPGMTAEQATKQAIVLITGDKEKGIEPDPRYVGGDPNREIRNLINPITGQNENLSNIQTLPVTPDALAALPNDQRQNSTVFTNGIFNDLQRGGELAIQQTPALDPNDPAQRQRIESTGNVTAGNTYLVHTDRANTFIGEMIVAGVEKGAELLGIATPAAQVAAQTTRILSTNTATSQTDNPVTSVGHSRGTMTQVNQLRTLADQGFYNSNLQVIANNPAAFESNLRQAGSQVTSPNNISIWAPKNDPVATFVGFYPGDWGASLQAFPSVFATSYSVHSSPGSGAVGSQNTDVNRPFSYNNLNIDQLNRTRAPQTQANLQALGNQAQPGITPVAEQDKTQHLQQQVQKDSNAQMNALVSNNAAAPGSAAPIRLPNSPILMSPSAYQKLLQLRQSVSQ
jgi:filamentous hemagglutinin